MGGVRFLGPKGLNKNPDAQRQERSAGNARQESPRSARKGNGLWLSAAYPKAIWGITVYA